MRERTLVRHFLHGLLDNDLISPHADRHQVLSVGVAALVTSSLFVTVLMGTQYVFMPFQSPGRTASAAVSDRFLYSGWSMIVMALVAVTQWDALVLDRRDAAILAPLPIAHRAIVSAKLAAVALFATAFAVALNGVPSVLHPVLMVATQSIGMYAVVALVAAHVAAVFASGAFGFLAVLACRGLLRAVLGEARFARVSLAAQTSLVLGLSVLFLLLPGLAPDLSGDRLASRQFPPLAGVLLWFPGLHELLAGHVIDAWPRGPLPGYTSGWESQALALYRRQQPVLRELGATGLVAFGAVALTAFVTYVWNSRQLPAPAVPPAARRRGRTGTGLEWLARHVMVRHPVAQGGFFFTLRVLARSAPHRLALAVSMAIGLAVSTTILRGIDLGPAARDAVTLPVGLLAIQNLLLMTLVGGLRHAMHVPAELRANWTFHLAFAGDERPYLSGVKRAALLSVVCPVLLALLPLHAAILGPKTAAVHAAWGALIALGLLEVAMLGLHKLPFASAYVPTGRLRTVGPPLLLLALGSAYALAWIERLALSTDNSGVLLAVAGAVVLALRGLDAMQRRSHVAMDLDEAPSPPTQRLGLAG